MAMILDGLCDGHVGTLTGLVIFGYLKVGEPGVDPKRGTGVPASCREKSAFSKPISNTFLRENCIASTRCRISTFSESRIGLVFTPILSKASFSTMHVQFHLLNTQQFSNSRST
jgi:hypothetical protein